MTDRKSYVGLSKNPFLDLYDDLSDLALCPTETPVKQIHPPPTREIYASGGGLLVASINAPNLLLSQPGAALFWVRKLLLC